MATIALIRPVKLGRSDLREVLTVVIFGTLASTAGLLPRILKTLASPVRPLASVAELATTPAARYYQLPRLRTQAQQVGWAEVEETRKGTTYIERVAACPVWADTNQRRAPIAWLVFRYDTTYRASNSTVRYADVVYQLQRSSALAVASQYTQPANHLERFPYVEARALAAQAVEASSAYRAADGPPLLLRPVAASLTSQAAENASELRVVLVVGNGLLGLEAV